jgi:hypothetical protein
MEDTQSGSSLWSLPLLCLGLGILAVCVLIPAAEGNKKLTADRDQLKSDLTQVDAQLAVNEAFLSDVKSDPELAERLAQRQMRQIRVGTELLGLKNVDSPQSVSPFDILSVAPPAPVKRYRQLTGPLGVICVSMQRQLYAIGLGLFMVAGALVLGVSSPDPSSGHLGKRQTADH